MIVRELFKDLSKNTEKSIKELKLVQYENKNDMILLGLQDKEGKSMIIRLANMSLENCEGSHQGSLDIKPFIKELTKEICIRFNKA